MFNLSDLPVHDDLANAFRTSAETDPHDAHLLKVYDTGVMYTADGNETRLNETSLGLPEGLVLWYLARQLRPEIVVETGFGRGGSAAFLLTALAPWNGRVISVDPAFRHWAGLTGLEYIASLGASDRHRVVEEASEFALPDMIKSQTIADLKLSYVDGSHHFDGTLFDFMFLDKVTPVGGVIGIDDAHAPAVRTVTSFVANNLPYRIHYATPRLVLCQKIGDGDREWDHFRPFYSSDRRDWDVHPEPPTGQDIPNATFAR